MKLKCEYSRLRANKERQTSGQYEAQDCFDGSRDSLVVDLTRGHAMSDITTDNSLMLINMWN